MNPVPDVPDSFRMEETLTARNRPSGDAEVDGTICRILARDRPQAWVMIETRPSRHARLIPGTGGGYAIRTAVLWVGVGPVGRFLGKGPLNL